ncbi:MAG: transcription-repair coupling factor [Verrucomicrobia bacterium]|nr:transcription-repair coupling factor [Verrucomicrobiota bacterium]
MPRHPLVHLGSAPIAKPGTAVFASVAQTSAAQALLKQLKAGGALSFGTVSSSAQPFFAVWLRELSPQRPIVVVTDGLKTQETFHQDVETWLRFGKDEKNPERALFYPAWETLPHEAKLPHADVISERLETLVALSGYALRVTHHAPIVVTSVTALLQRTFQPDHIRERTRVLKKGDRIDPLDLVEWLEDQGYEPEVQVNHKGEIALRGGIVDLFPLTSPWPVRLEFFGDELESLRTFDPVSQMSRDSIESVTVPPGGELGILKKLVAKSPESSAGTSDAQPKTPSPELGTLLSFLPRGTIFILAQPESLDEHAATYAELVPPNDPFYIAWDEFQQQLTAKGGTILSLDDAGATDELLTPVSVDDGSLVPHSSLHAPRFQSLDAFRPVVERAPDPQVAEAQRREFFAQLHRWSRQGYAVQVFCNNDGERQRFGEVWKDYGFEGGVSGQESGIREDEIQTHLGTLSRGFINEEARLVVVTDAEIFGRYKVQRPRRLKSPHAQTSRSLLDIDFSDLDDGDYVVHLQHGIGRYRGLQLMPISSGLKRLEKAAPAPDAKQECLVIEYAAADPTQPAPRLYVPVSEAHLVSKYVGAGKARPPLNTLGGNRWQKTKEHAERAVRDLAAELLQIQAARATQVGHTFKADTPWQREFESSFLYEETPDQWKAILATKGDMESSKPMDRLICGDVGYGKTEVAIRAAFKCVMDGRQVAILVPTTVLAQQHFNNFRERMADYPIRVELLSRFRTPRETKKVIQDLATGAVDIVIGTHRLLSKDVEFKDLGLVVIDEEQRFGVLHKEKFKLLRKMVDVLTLSATPIPRTLYLALTGARDMSTIETPPQDRLPVETIVTEYDERVIRDAIQRELNRGGQIFYLHNRVMDIQSVALKLRALLPKAKIVVGHGQMDPDELEEVMTAFINGEADVLLSTTIIESGIDIPNANTIIIDRADRFGLSELYQLRGRVGRYKHQAYAYLLVPRHARLLTDARKRMSAIKQYSTLGSGFKIAMRDLEIRGAGNLLGSQQSGHITAVGFELYCQLLKQSVAAMKGEKVKPRVEVQVRLDFLALNAAEEGAVNVERSTSSAQRSKAADDEPLHISIPRETATYSSRKPEATAPKVEVKRGFAGIPLSYVADAKQRIELYRKFAEVMDEESVSRLKAEMRDRFGPLPPAVELLLQVAVLKVMSMERNIGIIESKEDKLMLTRNNDFIMVGGKFPRLMKKEPRARLNEIRKLLQMLQ